MQNALHLEVVTPEKIVVSEDVEYVSAPSVEGDFGVLPNHVPLLAALKIGNIMYRKDGLNHYVFVSDGLAEVFNNKVTILAEVSEQAQDIDKARAVAAKERADKALNQKLEARELANTMAAMQRAFYRIKAADQEVAASGINKKIS